METNTQANDPERVAQGYLEAYGARDLETCMSYYADDVQYYVFPSTLICDSAAAVRQRLIARFQDTGLSARLLQRIVHGNLAISHQRLTLTVPEGSATMEVVAMQEVENGKIRRSWYKLGEPVVTRAP